MQNYTYDNDGKEQLGKEIHKCINCEKAEEKEGRQGADVLCSAAGEDSEVRKTRSE